MENIALCTNESSCLLTADDGSCKVFRNVGTSAPDKMSPLHRTWQSSPSVNILL